MQTMLGALGPGCSHCKVCHCNLGDKLSLYAADIDQAFESCQAANVVRSWAWVATTFEEKHGTSVIQVRKGKRFCDRIGARPWSRGWWLLKLDDLSKALLAASSGTVATLADAVVELDGMSIGGTLSASAVAVRLAAEESEAFTLPSYVAAGFEKLTASDLGWLRYVDDILACSKTVCSCYLALFFKQLFAERVSTVYSSLVDWPKPCVWLNFEIHIQGREVTWTLKNSNRRHLYGCRDASFEPAYLPWPDFLPYRFKQLRGIMISKLAMSWSSSLSTVTSALVVLEVCLDFLKLGYPVDLLRALTHSLPKLPSAILARQVIRSFQICLASPELPTMGKGDGRSKQNGRSNYNSN